MDEVRMSGLLEKRMRARWAVGSAAWRRYWFVLRGRLLVYYAQAQGELSPARGHINLGTARGVVLGRPHRHEIHVLQFAGNHVQLRADTRHDLEKWLAALLDACGHQFPVCPPVALQRNRASTICDPSLRRSNSVMRTLRRLSRRRTSPDTPTQPTAPQPPPLPDIDNDLYASSSKMWFARPPAIDELLNNDIYVSVVAKHNKQDEDDDTYTYISVPFKSNTVNTKADIHNPIPQTKDLLNDNIYESVISKNNKVEVEEEDDDTYSYITVPPKNKTADNDSAVENKLTQNTHKELLNNDIYISVVPKNVVEDDDTYAYIDVPSTFKTLNKDNEIFKEKSSNVNEMNVVDIKENDIYMSASECHKGIKENDIYISINNNIPTDKIPDKNTVIELVDYSEPLNLPDSNVEYVQPINTLRSLGHKTCKFMKKVVHRNKEKKCNQTPLISKPIPKPELEPIPAEPDVNPGPLEPDIEPEYETVEMIRPKVPVIPLAPVFKTTISELQSKLEERQIMEEDEVKPMLPPRLRHRMTEPQLDEILDELKCLELTEKTADVENEDESLSVKRLIERFDGHSSTANEQGETVTLRRALSRNVRPDSDELRILLEQLACVTHAPLGTRTTASLPAPLPSPACQPPRPRSEPDYDIPRPHRPITPPPAPIDSIPATRFLGHPLSIAPDSLEPTNVPALRHEMFLDSLEPSHT